MTRLSVRGGLVLKRHRALFDGGQSVPHSWHCFRMCLNSPHIFKPYVTDLTLAVDRAVGVPCGGRRSRLLGYSYRTKPRARRVPEVELVKASELARLDALPIGHVAVEANQVLWRLRWYFAPSNFLPLDQI